MFDRYPSPRRCPAIERDILSQSAALATRRSRPTARDVTPEESQAAERAILRTVYDEAVAAGLSPAPSDLSGSRLGAIQVIGPAEDGRWAVHNPHPTVGVAPDYTVSVESLLASYAHGELTLPGPVV